MLEEFRVDPATLEDPDARLPGPTVLAVWNALRTATDDPALQLAAPAALPFGAYRIIDYLVAASATVGDGVQRFARFFHLIAEEVTLQVEAEGDGHCLTLARADGGPVPPVYVDYVFAALVTRIRLHIQPDLAVAGVELRQPAPPAGTKAIGPRPGWTGRPGGTFRWSICWAMPCPFAMRLFFSIISFSPSATSKKARLFPGQ